MICSCSIDTKRTYTRILSTSQSSLTMCLYIGNIWKTRRDCNFEFLFDFCHELESERELSIKSVDNDVKMIIYCDFSRTYEIFPSRHNYRISTPSLISLKFTTTLWHFSSIYDLIICVVDDISDVFLDVPTHTWKSAFSRASWNAIEWKHTNNIRMRQIFWGERANPKCDTTVVIMLFLLQVRSLEFNEVRRSNKTFENVSHFISFGLVIGVLLRMVFWYVAGWEWKLQKPH